MVELRSIPPLFGIESSCIILPMSSGHINSTYHVSGTEGEFVLQSLNRSVFRGPEAVMGNIAAVERAFSGSEDICVPAFLTSGGRNFAEYGGEIWRMYPFAEADEAQGCKEYLAGKAFGTFIRLTAGIRLEPVISGYHDYGSYLRRLIGLTGSGDFHRFGTEAVTRLSALGEQLSGIFTPELPHRNIHGDAKTANVVIGKRVTVIDLDTAMKGYAAIDYGDLIRSVSSSRIPDLTGIKAATDGFAEGLEGCLTSDEEESLYYGILWSVGELAVRYLTDCISGERYFRDKTPEDCLARAEELLDQLSSFISCEGEISGIISSSFRK